MRRAPWKERPANGSRWQSKHGHIVRVIRFEHNLQCVRVEVEGMWGFRYSTAKEHFHDNFQPLTRLDRVG